MVASDQDAAQHLSLIFWLHRAIFGTFWIGVHR